MPSQKVIMPNKTRTTSIADFAPEKIALTTSLSRPVSAPKMKDIKMEDKYGWYMRHRKKEKNFSMPSGDSMQAANFAIVALFYFNISFFGFLILPFVMVARIFYFCHYFF